jgi:YegS/Rv2252/BmrU family lipid kinase
MVIANPTAGQGELNRKWDKEILPVLKETLKFFDFEFTRKQGEASQVAAKALADGYDLIVAMGGDGTLNEVVNGFFDGERPIRPEAAVGLLPFGSGGDFARSVPLPRDWRLAVKHLVTRKTRRIDIGRATFSAGRFPPRYFINIANAGVVASIMHQVNSLSRRIPPLARYLSGMVKGFGSYRNLPVRLRLTPQGTHRVNLTNVVIANGQYFGKGMHPAPQARLDDGFFDVVVLKNSSLARFLIQLPQIYGIKPVIPTADVEVFRAQAVSVETLSPAAPLPIEMDGETVGSGSAVFTIVPKAIQLKV